MAYYIPFSAIGNNRIESVRAKLKKVRDCWICGKPAVNRWCKPCSADVYDARIQYQRAQRKKNIK